MTAVIHASPIGSDFVGAQPREPGLSIFSLWNLEAFALFLYFYRDAFAGALRYYFSITKLDGLWFIPDLLAMVCILAFVQRYVIQGKSLIAILTILYMAFALYIGYIFLGRVAGMASSLKMIAPVFVGFCFCARDTGSYKKLLASIHIIFYVTILGIIASAHMRLPWVGFAYESFGATREAGKLWWTDANPRLAGFAADSTMAAFFVFITFVLTSIRRSLGWCLFWAPLGIYAIKLTTSKTTIGLIAIYLVCLIIIRLLPERHKFPMLRRMACLSFLTILIPIILMILFSGIDLHRSYPALYSMQDRINNSWQLPFVYMGQLMPLGYLTGCGLGCFNYPQQLFSNSVSYYVPVDNFYIGTYLMFGPIFVAFMVCVVYAVAKTTDIYKLTAAVVMNLFAVTVLAYGPASGLLMLGFAFSEVFRGKLADDSAGSSTALVPSDAVTLAPRPA
ncbi:hypothetical protein [Bradyrhizobium prioriisuperbiae]|uniref:hypothetical protein n=1 Tax=Bradyrhizobium prioriisuperbiae TaxID=2854389 RepID=UPI0028F05429|nr:hypothetical protein [Bradyrhizobium prioritasuperba]